MEYIKIWKNEIKYAFSFWIIGKRKYRARITPFNAKSIKSIFRQ